MYNKLKYFFSIMVLIVVAVLTIVLKLDFLSCFVCETTILYFMFLSERNLLNFGVGIAGSLAYVFISFNARLYGEVLYYLLVDIPLMVIAFINWLKHRETKFTVKSEKMKLHGLLLLIGLTTVCVFLLAIILKLYGGENVWIDSAVAVLSLMSTILMLSRKREQWFFWILLYIFAIILWLTSFNLLMVIMCTYSLIASIFGFVEWNNTRNLNTHNNLK